MYHIWFFINAFNAYMFTKSDYLMPNINITMACHIFLPTARHQSLSKKYTDESKHDVVNKFSEFLRMKLKTTKKLSPVRCSTSEHL